LLAESSTLRAVTVVGRLATDGARVGGVGGWLSHLEGMFEEVGTPPLRYCTPTRRGRESMAAAGALNNLARAAVGIGAGVSLFQASIYDVDGGYRAVMFDRLRGVQVPGRSRGFSDSADFWPECEVPARGIRELRGSSALTGRCCHPCFLRRSSSLSLTCLDACAAQGVWRGLPLSHPVAANAALVRHPDAAAQHCEYDRHQGSAGDSLHCACCSRAFTVLVARALCGSPHCLVLLGRSRL
jgi:hypothetical protein